MKGIQKKLIKEKELKISIWVNSLIKLSNDEWKFYIPIISEDSTMRESWNRVIAVK